MPIHYLGFFDWKIMHNKSKVYSISDEEFISLVSNNYTYSDILRALNLTTSGESSRTALKKRMQELSCDISHFNSSKTKLSKKRTSSLSLQDILVENSTYANRTRLKAKLLATNSLSYCCSICGISEWCNTYISLQLDHINGINNDNRLENLRLLCPNCHSQTDTFSGKNKKK
jgi:5-methylcytosine-specific restriction endonuclease McrA